MSPLSVLHITPYGADAWSYGGIPRVADTLTRSLVQRGHDVTLCATDVCSRTSRLRPSSERRWYLRPWNDGDTTTGVTTHIFPNLSNGLAYHWQLFTPVGLAGFVRRHAARFDVAHLHAYRNLPGVIAARELRRQRVPFILAPNGTAPRIERRRLLKRAFDGLGGDIVLRHASRITASASCRTRSTLTSFGNRCSGEHFDVGSASTVRRSSCFLVSSRRGSEPMSSLRRLHGWGDLLLGLSSRVTTWAVRHRHKPWLTPAASAHSAFSPDCSLDGPEWRR